MSIETFFSRYNTSEEGCECPAFHYNNLHGYSYLCKHMKVFLGVEEYDYDIHSPLIREINQDFNRNKFSSFKIKKKCEDKNWTYENICNTLGYQQNHKLKAKDIIEYSKIIGPNRYNTTIDYCECLSRMHAYPNMCKHMKRIAEQNKPKTPKMEADDKIIICEKKLELAQLERQIMDIREERKEFYIEREDFQKNFQLCGICYGSVTIKVGCCSGPLCLNCWAIYEDMNEKKEKNSSCPFCREPMAKLRDVLIDKFMNFKM